MRSRNALPVFCVVSLLAVGCRPTRDDAPGRTETRSGVLERGGEATPAAPGDIPRRVDPSDPQVPVARGTTPAPFDPDRPGEAAEVAVTERFARSDGGAVSEERRPLPGADDSPRPRWLPTTDRLSVIRSDDRDRNLGIEDAGRP